MHDILTGTPPELTYLHPLVREAWTTVWAIVSGLLIVLLGWMGLTLVVQEHLGRPQAGWREMVPRLVLGLTAAAASLWWCALVIDTADAVAGFVAASLDVTPGDLLRAPKETLLRSAAAGSVGMALVVAALYLVYGFFVLYVIVQMAIRLALIDVLLALAPIALGLWILPHTAGWGQALAADVHDDGVPAGGAADGAGAGVRVPAGVRGDRGVRARPGPGLEAPHVHGVHLPGHARAGPVGQRRDLRRVAAHDLLRHVLAGGGGARRPVHRAASRAGRRRGPAGLAAGKLAAGVAAGAAPAAVGLAVSGVRSMADMATGSGGGGSAAPRSASE